MTIRIASRSVKRIAIAAGAGAALAAGPVAASVAWAAPAPDPCSVVSQVTSLLPLNLPAGCSSITGALGGVTGSGGSLPDPTGIVSTVTGALGSVPGASSITGALGSVPGGSSLTGGLANIPGLSALSSQLGSAGLGDLLSALPVTGSAASGAASTPDGTVSASVDPAGASTTTPVATASVTPDPAGATLPFTGEPSWIPFVGALALGLGGLTGLAVLALRLLARRYS